MREASYVRETGNTSRRACDGRGTKARRSGSSIEKTSEKPSVAGRPSWWIRWDMTSGLFSVLLAVLVPTGAGVAVTSAGRLAYPKAQRPSLC